MPNKRRWDLLNTSFLLGTLSLALVLVPLEFRHSLAHWGEWVMFGTMFFLIGLGVTAGYHRLYSHRAYQASWPVRFVLLCLAAASFQNSALQWSSSHRIHHRHVDHDRDPYNSTKGFWYAHWLWVMRAEVTPIEGVADMEKDPLVRWQHKYHFLIGGLVALIPAGVGLLKGELAGYLIIGVLLRIVVTHHTTFFINSAAHFFGTRPYTDTNTARDNAFLAPFTYGEGYHNYHHMFQWDYRNGVKWYQFDPTKWLIWSLALVGLARGLRRVPDAAIRRARLAMEEKTLLASLATSTPAAHRLVAARARLDQALARMQEHVEGWEARKAERVAQKREAWELKKAEWKGAMIQCRAEVRVAYWEWKTARTEARKLAFA
ncbi:acyl-CoA desaturase [Mesoterricola silvestris]|uniref:acyl-CoA desaturase n=1 Tax=Mesoterricola silvestris TaxID=2927979 RepID=UPI002930D523|nr:fatty acid desaturase [Mesoterricola silvestris]